MDEELVAGRDYYLTDQGRLVYTEYFLRGRGYCCGLGCRHCPYEFVGDERERMEGTTEEIPGEEK